MAEASWPGDAEHGALSGLANSLIEALAKLSSRVVSGDTHYMIHSDFTARCRLQATSLESVLWLIRSDRYMPAFGLLRVSLEQVMVDRLVFLGTRFHQRVENVSLQTWTEWQEARDNGAPWTANIVEWERHPRSGNVRIVRAGLTSDSDEQVISIFYFLLEQYSSWLGPPEFQDQVEDGLRDVAARRQRAEENRAIYKQYLSWSALKDNLERNGLATSEAVARLEVHYRFLSGFVHPVSHVVDAVYGRNRTWPAYDHYSSELALMYVIVIASWELRSFHAMCDRPPRLGLSDWTDVDTLLEQADAHTAHLWWVEGAPHPYDYWNSANERAFALGDGQGEPTPPSGIDASSIPYYANPLTRLIALHRSAHEITTGYLYLSPWPRDDARFR